jgi:hypothetical protein
VGTTTVGSQYLHDNDPPEPWIPLLFECDIPVNRFSVPETINGQCTAYFYTNDDEWEAGGFPVLYSNNFNQPHLKRSTQEKRIDFEVRANKPKGWRSGTFLSSESIPSGTQVWFGCYTYWGWFPRFDYGGDYHYWYHDGNLTIPNTYPRYTGSQWTSARQNFKLSMDFEYTSAQNYVRTLTQGVSLPDNRLLTASYHRSATETTRVNTSLARFETFYRKLYEAVTGKSTVFYMTIFTRIIQEAVKVKYTFRQWGTFCRGLIDITEIRSGSGARKGYLLTVKLIETVKVTGLVLRGLILFVRIISGIFVRDYLLRRFLKASSEMVLKSPICREITLDSKIG